MRTFLKHRCAPCCGPPRAENRERFAGVFQLFTLRLLQAFRATVFGVDAEELVACTLRANHAPFACSTTSHMPGIAKVFHPFTICTRENEIRRRLSAYTFPPAAHRQHSSSPRGGLRRFLDCFALRQITRLARSSLADTQIHQLALVVESFSANIFVFLTVFRKGSYDYLQSPFL
jgi:hypothetical protein